MDELDAQAGVSDPFQPAARVEDEEVVTSDDGSASRRAVRLQKLGLYATKGVTALVLIGAGALTMRVVSSGPGVPTEAVAPPLSVPDERLSDGAVIAYPDVEDLLAPDRDERHVKVQPEKNTPRGKHSRVRLAAGAGSRGSSRSVEVTAPAISSSGGAAPSAPSQTQEQGPDGPKSGSGQAHGENKEKPEPAPKPDRNLYHVWKQGTPDHVYYWEAWKTVDYYAPMEYYLYRDGNGSEGSFFSEQVAGTIPLTTDDGPLGYVYASGGDGRIPLYYLRGPNNHRRRDLYTSDATTRATFDDTGWTDFGIVGYLGAPFQE